VALLSLTAISSYAVEQSPMLQQKLMDIASEEAQIAGIGANKYMMLYGKKNALDTINRWNEIQHNPPLTSHQVKKITELENIKKQLLGTQNEQN
jgi:hypothetical protein